MVIQFAWLARAARIVSLRMDRESARRARCDPRTRPAGRQTATLAAASMVAQSRAALIDCAERSANSPVRRPRRRKMPMPSTGFTRALRNVSLALAALAAAAPSAWAQARLSDQADPGRSSGSRPAAATTCSRGWSARSCRRIIGQTGDHREQARRRRPARGRVRQEPARRRLHGDGGGERPDGDRGGDLSRSSPIIRPATSSRSP